MLSAGTTSSILADSTFCRTTGDSVVPAEDLVIAGAPAGAVASPLVNTGNLRKGQLLNLL